MQSWEESQDQGRPCSPPWGQLGCVGGQGPATLPRGPGQPAEPLEAALITGKVGVTPNQGNKPPLLDGVSPSHFSANSHPELPCQVLARHQREKDQKTHLWLQELQSQDQSRDRGWES